MKKVEIKKEEKKSSDVGIKKIDELYSKKTMAKKTDVGKKTSVRSVSKRKSTSVMSDMLPAKKETKAKASVKNTIASRRKSINNKSGLKDFNSSEVLYGGMTKDEILEMDLTVDRGLPVIEDEKKVSIADNDIRGENENVLEEENDQDDEAAIVAMREEIRNKLKNKTESSESKVAVSDVVENVEIIEKKSFFDRFSFRKKSIENSQENVSVRNEEKGDDEKKVDELASLSDEERKAVEKKTTKDSLIVAFLVFVIMVTIGITAFYFYVQYRKPGMVPNISLSSAEQAKKDADDTKIKISEVIELPDDEEPILATVTDVEKVKKQKFFTNAQNGDRVLIYTINKKAILFRPTTNKIIEVSQVSGLDYGNTSASNSVDTQPATPATGEQLNSTESSGTTDKTEAEVSTESLVEVAVYNGSKIKGLAQKIGDMVMLIPEVAIKEKSNAKNEYEKTIVIDLSGEQEDMAQRIAEALHAEVVTEFPAGERKPKAKILVIGGSNFQVAE